MCSTRHVDEAKIHLHKGTWSASLSPVHLTGESQSAEAFTRFCRPILPMIQPGITRCHREVKDYLKVRTVRCVGITTHVWLLTCGTRMWEKWVVNIPLLSLYISWHFLYNSPVCIFSPSTFQFVHEKAPVTERCSTPPFATVLISFIPPHLQENEPLYGLCDVSFTQTCHVWGKKKRGHLTPVS